jgi:hypothetical protein
MSNLSCPGAVDGQAQVLRGVMIPLLCVSTSFSLILRFTTQNGLVPFASCERFEHANNPMRTMTLFMNCWKRVPLGSDCAGWFQWFKLAMVSFLYFVVLCGDKWKLWSDIEKHDVYMPSVKPFPG